MSGEVSISDFEILSFIGKGGFGNVWRVKERKTNNIYAMKIIPKSDITENNLVSHTNTEFKIMKDLYGKPFIIKLHYAFQSASSIYFVMDFIGGGSLFSYSRKIGTKFSEDDTKFFIAQVIIGLESIHKKHFIYRDLKLENILIGEDGYIYLSDFGLSAYIKNEKCKSFSGTGIYISPEIIGGKGHDEKTDYWSLGILAFILMTYEPPFFSEDKKTLFNLILKQNIDFTSYSYLSPSAVSFLQSLLQKKSKDRLGAKGGIEEIKAHEFLKSVNWKRIKSKKEKAPFIPTISGGQIVASKYHPPVEPVELSSDLFANFYFESTAIQKQVTADSTPEVAETPKHKRKKKASEQSEVSESEKEDKKSKRSEKDIRRSDKSTDSPKSSEKKSERDLRKSERKATDSPKSAEKRSERDLRKSEKKGVDSPKSSEKRSSRDIRKSTSVIEVEESEGADEKESKKKKKKKSDSGGIKRSATDIDLVAKANEGSSSPIQINQQADKASLHKRSQSLSHGALEAAEGDEQKKGEDRKIKRTGSMLKISAASDELVSLAPFSKRKGLNSIKVEFQISVTIVKKLPEKFNGKKIEFSWKCGSKSINSGKSDVKYLIENGEIHINLPFIIFCSLYQNQQPPFNFIEKNILFLVKMIQDSKKQTIAQGMADLAQFGSNNEKDQVDVEIELKNPKSKALYGMELKIKTVWVNINNEKLNNPSASSSSESNSKILKRFKSWGKSSKSNRSENSQEILKSVQEQNKTLINSQNEILQIENQQNSEIDYLRKEIEELKTKLEEKAAVEAEQKRNQETQENREKKALKKQEKLEKTKETEEKLKENQEKLEVNKKQIENLENKIKEISRKNKKLKQENVDISEKNKILNSENQQKDEKIQTQNEEINKKDEKIELLSKKHQKSRGEDEKQLIKMMEDEKNQLKLEVQKKTSEIENLTEQFVQIQKNQVNLDKKIKKLKKQNETLQNQIKEISDEKLKILDNLKNIENEKNQIFAENEKLKEENRNIKEENQQKTILIQEKEQKSGSSDKKSVKKLKTEIEQLKNQLKLQQTQETEKISLLNSDLNKKLEEKQAKINSLEENLKEYLRKLNEEEKNVSELKRTVSKQEMKLATPIPVPVPTVNPAELLKEKENTQKMKDKLKKNREKLKENQKNYEKYLQEKNEKIQNLESNLQEKLAAFQENQKKIENLEILIKEKEKLEKENVRQLKKSEKSENVQKENEKLVKKIESLENLMEEQENTIKEKENSEKVKNQEIEKLKNQIKNLNQENQEKEREKDEIIENLQAELDEKRKKQKEKKEKNQEIVRDLEEKLENFQNQLNTMDENEINAMLRKENEKIQLENEKLKNQNETQQKQMKQIINQTKELNKFKNLYSESKKNENEMKFILQHLYKIKENFVEISDENSGSEDNGKSILSGSGNNLPSLHDSSSKKLLSVTASIYNYFSKFPILEDAQEKFLLDVFDNIKIILFSCKYNLLRSAYWFLHLFELYSIFYQENKFDFDTSSNFDIFSIFSELNKNNPVPKSSNEIQNQLLELFLYSYHVLLFNSTNSLVTHLFHFFFYESNVVLSENSHAPAFDDNSAELFVNLNNLISQFKNEFHFSDKIVIQIVNDIFIFFNAKLFNEIICNSQKCSAEIGFKMKLSLSKIYNFILEDTEFLGNLFSPLKSHLKSLTHLADALIILPNQNQDFSSIHDILDTFSSLSVGQLKRLVSQFSFTTLSPETIPDHTATLISNAYKKSSRDEKILLDFPFPDDL